MWTHTGENPCQERQKLIQLSRATHTLSSFGRDAITKYHKLGGLKETEMFFSQFWMPGV